MFLGDEGAEWGRFWDFTAFFWTKNGHKLLTYVPVSYTHLTLPTTPYV